MLLIASSWGLLMVKCLLIAFLVETPFNPKCLGPTFLCSVHKMKPRRIRVTPIKHKLIWNVQSYVKLLCHPPQSTADAVEGGVEVSKSCRKRWSVLNTIFQAWQEAQLRSQMLWLPAQNGACQHPITGGEAYKTSPPPRIYRQLMVGGRWETFL